MALGETNRMNVHIVSSTGALTNSLAEVLEALGELVGRGVEVDARCGVLNSHASLSSDGGNACGEGPAVYQSARARTAWLGTRCVCATMGGGGAPERGARVVGGEFGSLDSLPGVHSWCCWVECASSSELEVCGGRKSREHKAG